MSEETETPRERANARIEPISTRVRDTTITALKAIFPDKSTAASYAIEGLLVQYRRALAEVRGRLTPGEARLILDALNGGMLLQAEHPELAGQHVRLEVADAISLNRADEKHGVDAEHLRATLAGFTSFQLVALELWAGAFWASDLINDEAYLAAHVALLSGAPAP